MLFSRLGAPSGHSMVFKLHENINYGLQYGLLELTTIRHQGNNKQWIPQNQSEDVPFSTKMDRFQGQQREWNFPLFGCFDDFRCVSSLFCFLVTRSDN